MRVRERTLFERHENRILADEEISEFVRSRWFCSTFDIKSTKAGSVSWMDSTLHGELTASRLLEMPLRHFSPHLARSPKRFEFQSEIFEG